MEKTILKDLKTSTLNQGNPTEELLLEKYNVVLSSDYQMLKDESKILLTTGNLAFILAAERLKIIRDDKLYEQDLDENGEQKYSSFSQFIDAELSVTRQTVYNYIYLSENFLRTDLLHADINFSKLFPYKKLLNSDGLSQKDKNEIIKNAISDAKQHSAKECKESARKLEIEHGVTKEICLFNRFELFRSELYFDDELILTFNETHFSEQLSQRIYEIINSDKDLINQLLKEKEDGLQ